jgi:hypothetical protein
MPEGECKHGIPIESCTYCRKSRNVVYTDGGLRYHVNSQCENLIWGQNEVRERGGTLSPIHTGPEHIVRQSKDPCHHCITWR